MDIYMSWHVMNSQMKEFQKGVAQRNPPTPPSIQFSKQWRDLPSFQSCHPPERLSSSAVAKSTISTPGSFSTQQFCRSNRCWSYTSWFLWHPIALWLYFAIVLDSDSNSLAEFVLSWIILRAPGKTESYLSHSVLSQSPFLKFLFCQN